MKIFIEDYQISVNFYLIILKTKIIQNKKKILKTLQLMKIKS